MSRRFSIQLCSFAAVLALTTPAAFGQAGQYPANQFLGGPASGGSSLPKPRALVGADLPNPGASSLGGIESTTCATHMWLSTISIAGVPVCTQPAFSDLSGTPTTLSGYGITSPLPIAQGGTAGATQQAALNSIACTPTRAGDVMYYNGTNWVCFAGNNLGTQVLSENSSGMPSWVTSSSVFLPVAQGRLTLASGIPVMGATSCGGLACTSQGTIYYDCYNGSNVTYYNGTTDVTETISGCEVSTALQTTGTGVLNANDVFDVWWVHSGTNRICVATNGSGAGWSGDTGGSVTARGTGYTQLNRTARGYLTNANTITHCYNGLTDYGSVSANQATYLGTIATTSSAGKVGFYFGAGAAGGSPSFLGVWNYYNRLQFTTNVSDTGGSYTYTTATIRQARASSGNQIQFVLGAAEDSVQSSYSSWIATAAATNAQPEAGIGLDSTTTFQCVPAVAFGTTAANYVSSVTSPCTMQSGAGLHTISANEKSDGTNANTFQDNAQSTLSASLRM